MILIGVFEQLLGVLLESRLGFKEGFVVGVAAVIIDV